MIYFIVWTIKNIRKSKERIDLLENKVDMLYREREADFLKMEKMQNKIEELEKQKANTTNEKSIDRTDFSW